MDQLSFLSSEIEQKIETFKGDSKAHKVLHRKFRYASYAFTAVLSILSGLALYKPQYAMSVNVLILIVAGISGFVASIEGLRKADELWIHERKTYYALIDLKRELIFEQHGGINEKKLNRLFAKLQNILSTAGDKWSTDIVDQGKDIDTDSQSR